MKWTTLLAILVAVAACDRAQEVQGPWIPVETVADAVTKHYDCGEEANMYLNTSTKAQTVAFDIQNDCEFSAYLYTYGPNGHFVRVRSIAGYSSLSDTAGIEAGGRLDLQCCLVSTIENKGCNTSYVILGVK